MKLTALLLELEGTLVETEDIHRRAFNAAFREFGESWLWDEPIYRQLLAVGGGKERIKNYIERVAPDYKERKDFSIFLDSMHKAKNLAFKELIRSEGVVPRRGVMSLIESAKEAKIHLAITTSMTQENVNCILEQAFGNLSLFDVIAYGDSVPLKKPSPDLYVWALEELAVPEEAAFAIEGTPHGVRGALNAGINVVVTLAYYTKDENFDGAIAVLDSLGDKDNPFRCVAGDCMDNAYVTLDLMRKWHENNA